MGVQTSFQSDYLAANGEWPLAAQKQPANDWRLVSADCLSYFTYTFINSLFLHEKITFSYSVIYIGTIHCERMRSDNCTAKADPRRDVRVGRAEQ